MEVIITKVGEELFHGTAASLTVPALDGELTILPHHEPIITVLKKGTVRVRTAAEQQTFEIENGFVEMSANKATVLL